MRESAAAGNRPPRECEISSHSQQLAFRAVFGDWVVRDDHGRCEWATRLPSQHTVTPGYYEAIESVGVAFGSAIASRDASRCKAIQEHDTNVMIGVLALEPPGVISAMTSKELSDWLPTLIFSELQYLSLQTTPLPRFSRVMSAAMARCYEYDAVSVELWDQMHEQERESAWTIRQGIATIEQGRAEQVEILGANADFTMNQSAKADNADFVEEGLALDSADIFNGSDCGVEVFRFMDAWDIIVYLGLVDLQDVEQRNFVQLFTKEEAHERVCGPDGKPVRGKDGEWIWKNEELHLARMQVKFPGLNRLDSEPLNRKEWDSYVAECTRNGLAPSRSTATHSPIFPSVHQLAGVANIVARGHLDPQYAPYHSHTLLQDDIGLGKTLQFFMVITILDFYRSAVVQTPTTCPPVMKPWKKEWSIGRKIEGSDEVVNIDDEFINQNMIVKWIGDRNLEQYTSGRHRMRFRRNKPIAPSLILSSSGAQQSHVTEFTRFVDHSQFICLQFPKGVRHKPDLHKAFIELVDAKTRAGYHVVIAMTYEEATLVSQRVMHHEDDDNYTVNRKQDLRESTIFKLDWVFDVLVLDEVHLLRNTQKDRCKAVQSLAHEGMTCIGATGLPIFSSPLDIIGEATAMGHGKVVVNLGQGRADTGNPFAWIDEVESTWNDIRQLRARTDHSTLASKTQQEIQEVDSGGNNLVREARWFGMQEAEATVNGEEIEGMRVRDSFRSKLQTGVAQPILRHLGPYILRRTRISKNLFDDFIINLPPVDIVTHSLRLNHDEQAAYDDWTNMISESMNPQLQAFQALARKYNLDPHYATTGWFKPTLAPSRKMQKIISLCRAWDKQDLLEDQVDTVGQCRPVQQQKKLLIRTVWTSQLKMLQIRLAQAGIFTKVLSGDTLPAVRETIISDFRKDEAHMSDPIAYITGDNTGVLLQSRPCRILIITSVCSGIDLSRANHMIMVDQFFTHQEFVQAHGLIVRESQTRACIIDIIVVEKTCDDRMAIIAASKGMAQATLFGEAGCRTSVKRGRNDVNEARPGTRKRIKDGGRGDGLENEVEVFT